mgnify:CR=1 FL=1
MKLNAALVQENNHGISMVDAWSGQISDYYGTPLVPPPSGSSLSPRAAILSPGSSTAVAARGESETLLTLSPGSARMYHLGNILYINYDLVLLNAFPVLLPTHG